MKPSSESHCADITQEASVLGAAAVNSSTRSPASLLVSCIATNITSPLALHLRGQILINSLLLSDSNPSKVGVLSMFPCVHRFSRQPPSFGMRIPRMFTLPRKLHFRMGLTPSLMMWALGRFRADLVFLCIRHRISFTSVGQLVLFCS